MSSYRTVHTLCVAIFAIPVACYAGYLVCSDWSSQAHLRTAAAFEEAEQSRWDRIHDAAVRLERNGARYEHMKGICFRWIDLSKWEASVSELEDLRALVDLSELRGGDSSLFIRLGPNIDSSILPILRDVKNLEVLDPNGAHISSAELDDLVAKLPNCRLGCVSFDFD